MRVFISYSSKDRVVADRFVEDLGSRGFDVLIDRQDLPYGEEWQGQLADMIRTSDTVVWLASENSVVSRWCRWELGEVQRLSKRLVPVRIAALDAAILPEALGRIHILPVDDVYDRVRHLDLLVRTLETDGQWIGTQTRLADRAAEWASRGRTADRLLRGKALADAEAWRDSKPASAPAPNSETLDLLLQSRRAATRQWRILSGVALGALVITLGLAAYALLQAVEARSLRDLAQIAREEAVSRAREAELQGARVSTSLAPNLLANGQVDPALLLLLSTRDSYGRDPAPDALEIAFHRVLESVYRRQVYELPLHSAPFVSQTSIYIVDRDSHDLWRFDGGEEPQRILVGASEDRPIIGVGDGPDSVLIVRDDYSVHRLGKGHEVATPVGTFPDAASISAVSEIAFHPDGVVTLWSNQDRAVRLVDSLSGATYKSVPDVGDYTFYQARDDGTRFIVTISGFLMDDPTITVVELTRSGAGFVIGAPTDDRDFGERAYFDDCVRRSFGPPTPFVRAAIAQIIYPGLPHVCWGVGGGHVLVSQLDYTSAGIDRYETLFRPDGTEIDLTDAPPFSTKTDQFTWLVADPVQGTVAGVVNRDVAIATPDGETFYEDFTTREPEAPVTGRLFSDGRLALVEPEAGRLVIYRYGDDVRPSTIASSQAAIVGGQKFAPLNAGSCVGYALTEAVDRNVTGPNGIAMVIVGGTATSRSGPPGLQLADGRLIGFNGDDVCLQLSADRRRVVVDSLEGPQVYDLPALIAGSPLDEARLPAPPVGRVNPAFPLPDGDLIIADGSESVRRWHMNEDGVWTSTVLFTGEKPVIYAEPNADGSRLIIVEWLGDSYVGGQLYSVAARSKWRDLGSDYKWYGAAFDTNGDIVTGQSFVPTQVLRLPPLEELVEEARSYLPSSCLPPAGAAYRESSCWPTWL